MIVKVRDALRQKRHLLQAFTHQTHPRRRLGTLNLQIRTLGVVAIDQVQISFQVRPTDPQTYL
jgi:hypothetical protein